MNNYSVVIDAGHGGTDSGASSGNVLEKDLNLMISRYMYEQFRNRGIPVTLIRETDETITPTERVRRILNAYGDNSNVVVISNHINAASSEYQGAEGAEVIYALRNNGELAKNILQALENAGAPVRTYYQRRLPSNTARDYYFIHRDTGTTEPVIVEYGFIDNPEDLQRIQNNYQKYVDAVVNAVIATKQGSTIEPDYEGLNIYVVKSGDSLYSIANRYNTTVNEIKTLNNLTSNSLSIGQKLQIPTTNQNAGATGTTYTVKSGDSLYSIANRYNTTVNEIKTLNNLTSNTLQIGQILRIPTEMADSSDAIYIVKSGDSLYSIANRYNTTVDEIKRLNDLASNLLSIGQRLQIPTTNQNIGTTYTVKSGDSLYSIARNYNTTVDEIKRLNNLTSNLLSIGQVLRIR